MGQNLELARKVAGQLPTGSKLVVFPGVGHVPHLETPDEFHRELLDFISK